MVTSTCMTTMGILYAKSIEKLKKRKTLKMTSRLVDRRWSLIRPFYLGVPHGDCVKHRILWKNMLCWLLYLHNIVAKKYEESCVISTTCCSSHLNNEQNGWLWRDVFTTTTQIGGYVILINGNPSSICTNSVDSSPDSPDGVPPKLVGFLNGIPSLWIVIIPVYWIV